MITLIIANILYSYIIYLLMNGIYKEKSNDKLTEIISYILFFGTITLFSNYESGIESYFVLAGMLFVISLNYGNNYYSRICITILIFLFTNMLYITVFAICRPYFNDNTIDFYYAILLFSRFLMVLIYIGFMKFKIIIENLMESEKHSFIIIMTPMITLFIIYNAVLTMKMTIWLIIDIIGLCIINVIIFYMFEYIHSINEKKSEDELIKQQNTYYNMQFELMRESNEKLRALRHDLKNHIMYLQRGSLSDEHISEYKSMLDSMLSNHEYAKSGNLAVDSILNFKINQAIEKGFDFKLKLIIPEQISVKETDLVILLGNIIDNSIEHCSETKKQIRMTIRYEYGILYIDSSNESEKISIIDGKIISNKPDKDNHGIGLKNISRVLEKYNGEVSIESENNRFRISIIIPG